MDSGAPVAVAVVCMYVLLVVHSRLVAGGRATSIY